jgi:hypothetical protein
MNRPLTLLARQTQTDAELLPPRHQALRKASIREACGGLNSNRYANRSALLPEGMKLLPGQTCFERSREGCSGKKAFLSADCLRLSAVNIFAGL